MDRSRKLVFHDSFGGQRRAIPAVQTICTTQPFAVCDTCNEIPNGDYWKHWSSSRTLCRKCMTNETYMVTFHSKSKVHKHTKLNILNEFTVGY